MGRRRFRTCFSTHSALAQERHHDVSFTRGFLLTEERTESYQTRSSKPTKRSPCFSQTAGIATKVIGPVYRLRLVAAYRPFAQSRRPCGRLSFPSSPTRSAVSRR